MLPDDPVVFHNEHYPLRIVCSNKIPALGHGCQATDTRKNECINNGSHDLLLIIKINQ